MSSEHGKACTIAISEWKGNDKNYVDREDSLNCTTIGTYVGEDDVNAAENNARRGKTARILRPNGRCPIRDNETKTDNLKSVSNEKGFEDVNTLEMQQDRTTKVLGAGGDGSILPVHLPFLSVLSYRRN